MSTDNSVVGYVSGLNEHPPAVEALDLPYAWLEAPLEACLCWTSQVSDWKDLNRWPSGRLFGEQTEYRWQANARGQLHIVLLTEQPWPSELHTSDPAELVELQCERDSYCLMWGDWIDPSKDPNGNPNSEMWFYAPEIPQEKLIYPVENKTVNQQAPCLTMRHYQSDEHGEFVRCVTVSLRSLEKEA